MTKKPEIKYPVPGCGESLFVFRATVGVVADHPLTGCPLERVLMPVERWEKLCDLLTEREEAV